MTTALTITALPYSSDPLALFAKLRQRPGAVLLDSGRPKATTGRYDILSSDPLATLKISPDGHTAFESDTLTLPPSLMGNSHAQQQWLLEQLPTANLKSELPFLGGLMGYWSYDLGRNHADIPSQHPPVTQLPLARLGLFDWCITFDHVTEQAWLVGSEQRRKQSCSERSRRSRCRRSTWPR